MSSSARVELLRELIAGRSASRDVAARLAVFGWDSDDELVVLRRADVLGIVERYLCGDVTAMAVVEWANAIEGRDDIGYEPGREDLLRDLVFELANPDMTRQLTPEGVTDWANRFRDA